MQRDRIILTGTEYSVQTLGYVSMTICYSYNLSSLDCAKDVYHHVLGSSCSRDLLLLGHLGKLLRERTLIPMRNRFWILLRCSPCRLNQINQHGEPLVSTRRMPMFWSATLVEKESSISITSALDWLIPFSNLVNPSPRTINAFRQWYIG
jgi:hypothetical protein